MQLTPLLLLHSLWTWWQLGQLWMPALLLATMTTPQRPRTHRLLLCKLKLNPPAQLQVRDPLLF